MFTKQLILAKNWQYFLTNKKIMTSPFIIEDNRNKSSEKMTEEGIIILLGIYSHSLLQDNEN